MTLGNLALQDVANLLWLYLLLELNNKVATTGEVNTLLQASQCE